MKIILTASNIKTDDDYKTVLKTRMTFALILIIMGIVAIIIAQVADSMFGIALDSHQKDFIAGIGSGSTLGGIILFIRYLIILRNDDKVRKTRIAGTDERVQQLSGKALVASGLILFVCLYIVAIVGGLFYPILTKVALALIAIFLLSYLIIYRILAGRS